MEKILRIEVIDFKKEKDDWRTYSGWQIITSEQTIKIGIDNGQSCCESWGYLITNDDTTEFIGAQLIGISITDTSLNNKKIEELECLDAGGAMFVNLETDRGLLQFVTYNGHNGYYGHESVLISKQINHEEYL